MIDTWPLRLLRLALVGWLLPLALVGCVDVESTPRAVEPSPADSASARDDVEQAADDSDGDGVADDTDDCPGIQEDGRWSDGADGCPDGLEDLIALAASDIDAFWNEAFAASDQRYAGPEDFEGYGGTVLTGCGETVPDNAFYCLADHSIYYDEGLLQSALEAIGDFGPVFIIAHEWGHLVQAELGIFGDESRFGIQNELQADCFAGVYAANADERRMLEEGDLDEAAQSLLAAGDPAGTPWYDPAAHGTAEERISAFALGFEEGLAACLEI